MTRAFPSPRFLPAPKSWFAEGTAQVFRGDSSTVYAANRRQDLSVVGHLRGYRDLSESTNLDLGISYSRGHSNLGFDFGPEFLDESLWCGRHASLETAAARHL